MIKREGWRILWVDAVLTAQVPRLNSHLPEMRVRLAQTLGAEGRVNLKAKSPEGTDDPGAARSMVCWVVATLSGGEMGDD